MRSTFSRLISRLIGDFRLSPRSQNEESAMHNNILRDFMNQEVEATKNMLSATNPHIVEQHFFLSPEDHDQWFLSQWTLSGQHGTARFIIHKKDGVFRSDNGGKHFAVRQEEIDNLHANVLAYERRVAKIYAKYLDRSSFDLAA